jgi:hypothetical protein
LISPFAACRFSRLSNCISKVVPRLAGLESPTASSNVSRDRGKAL